MLYNIIMKIIQDINIKFNKEIETLKMSQNEIKCKMKHSGNQIRSSEERLTDRWVK